MLTGDGEADNGEHLIMESAANGPGVKEASCCGAKSVHWFASLSRLAIGLDSDEERRPTFAGVLWQRRLPQNFSEAKYSFSWLK